jgi:hypothetical protein
MFSMMPHVLDDAEHRHVDFTEHVEALAGIQKRDVLRRRDDHRAGQGHLLGHGELGVAGARRHVDQEQVELAPGDVAQHLLQGARHHGAAPDHRAGELGRPLMPSMRGWDGP